MMLTGLPVHRDALSILESGIDAVRPAKLFPALFKSSSDQNLNRWLKSDQRWLLSLGKAGTSSAVSITQLVPCTDYFVVAPEAQIPVELNPNSIHFGSHPLPDAQSFHASSLLLQWLQKIPPNSPLLVVLSGGASALVASPAPGISEESKTRLNDLLIRCGASITEINTVRKHCSSVKGGQLGVAVNQLDTMVLVISDVPSNDLSAIASGPFYPDNTTFIAAKHVLEKYEIWDSVPKDIKARIENGVLGQVSETPKPGALSIPHLIVASNEIARHAAKRKAEQLGYKATNVSELLVKPVEEAAKIIRNETKIIASDSVLVFGGEVTVKVSGNGTGGRNQHLALLMTEAISNREMIFAAAGTDGVDGNSTAAGAWTDGTTSANAKKLNLSIQQFIANHDSFHFFNHLNQSIVTGPTGTNVMDLYLLLSAKVPK